MAKFVINGGKPLHGKIKVSGSKNAGLKMLAACVLTNKPCTLSNMPKISDIDTMLQIIQDIGGKTTRKNHRITVDASSVKQCHPDDRLINLMRASVVIVGPLIARFKEAEISQPGGCLIGARPIDTHIDAFRQLGVDIRQKNNHYLFRSNDKGGFKRVILKEMSVTATENVMMAAVLRNGKTEIRVAAAEPEIEDLANFLNKMGAKISGAGTHVINVTGVKKLEGAEYSVMPDRIEAGTFIIMAIAAKGNVEVQNIIPTHLDALLHKLNEMNVNYTLKSNSIIVKPTASLKPVYIDTRPYPGFSTDLQSPMAVLLTQANGTSRIFETLFESRFNYVSELSKMGADISVLNPHTLVIHGPTPLCGKKITAHDLRAGASLVIAALCARGQSIIDNIELIERGYESLEKRLKLLGADIERLE